MMVDTTIHGYLINECAFVHPSCLSDGDTVNGRLYYLDDEDPHGLVCDECCEYIFEPVPLHEYRADRDMCDYGCNSYCGEGAECHLHVEPDIEPED